LPISLADRAGGVAEHGHRDGALLRRTAGHPRRGARGGADRRRRAAAGVPQDHRAAAAADDALRLGDDDHRLPQCLRGAVRDDRRRSRRQHAHGLPAHVRGGLPLLPHGLRERHGVCAVHRRARRHAAPAPPAEGQDPMKALDSEAAPARPGRTDTSGVPGARAVTYTLLSVGLLVMSAPFVWMGLSAFKTQADLGASPPVWIPTTWTLDNFRELLSLMDVGQAFLNSAAVAVLVTLCNLLFCSMLGYALAKLNFSGKRVVFGVVLGALMVPGNLMLLPKFVMMSKMELLDTYAALILPFAAGAFGVFLMRQFMSAIPDELLEAARIDGAREWYIFWRIVLPLVKPA